MDLVQKYSGKYLRNREDIDRIAEYVSEYRSRVDGLVLVCSSLREFIDQRIGNGKSDENELSERERRQLFHQGEVETAELLVDSLTRHSLPARLIADIRGSLDLVDREDGKHEFLLDEIRRSFAAGEVAVVPGFQGVGELHIEGGHTHNGSSMTAVAIAGGIGCDCEFYGTSRGIYVVDPRASENKTVYQRICHEEAMELLMHGESDLEPEAIELSKTLNVNLYVGPAFDQNKRGGTYIVDRSLIVEEAAVSGISVSDDIVMYTIRGIPTRGDGVSEIFETLGDLGVNIDVISQQAYSNKKTAVSFSCSAGDIPNIDKSFESNARFRDLEITHKDDLCLVSLVGVGMATHVGVAGRVFKTLAENEIRHYNITTSEISISTAIDKENKTRAVIALSEEFSL